MAFRPLPARASAALLREQKPLKALFNQAQRLSHLQSLLEAQLEPSAREHCRIASWRDGCLMLVVTDGQWATRLRYQQRRLQKALVQLDEFRELHKILFKVQPPKTPMRGPLRTVHLSPKAALSIRESAEHVSDERLREALERLASRTLRTPRT